MSLRPPSTSPSTSPAPPNLNGGGTPRSISRASLGPSFRPAPINLGAPVSPRPGSGRPTSEVLSGVGMFQTPEADAIDQWFENLQSYDATLEDMAAASLDVNFKEELGAIEQWFRVLSEAERTAALYSLLQHSTQVQIRFFITVLHEMARADPMTAILSPNAGGSMQSQMEAKLAQMGLKSPGLGNSAGPPASPTTRSSFGSSGSALHRQSLAVLESTPSATFLSPDSAANAGRETISVGGGGSTDAAVALAHSRAKLKANANHRVSAPPVSGMAGDRNGMVWGGQLTQVAERSGDSGIGDGSSDSSPIQELTIPTSISGGMPAAGNSSSRPKSTDFSGLLRSPRLSADVVVDGDHGPNNNEAKLSSNIAAVNAGSLLSPMAGGNWASMVNTPLVPLFNNNRDEGKTLDAAAGKLSSWQIGNSGGRFSLDDAKKFRRPTKVGSEANNAIYNDDGTPISRGPSGVKYGSNWANPGSTSAAMRSPALSSVSSGRFGSDGGVGDGGFGMPSPSANVQGLAALQAMNLPMQMNMLAQMQQQGMGMNGLNVNGLQGLNGMQGMGGVGGMAVGGMNPLMQGMMGGLAPEQLLAAQMFMQPGAFGMGAAGLGGLGMMNATGVGGQRGVNHGRTGRQGMSSGKSANGRDGSSVSGTGSGSGGVKIGSGGAGDKGAEDEVDPQLLEDLPAWLRKLRLHKYTPLFEKMHWRDLVVMDETDLEKAGVAALGARRKMVKTFEVVRAKMGVEMPPGKVSAKESEGEQKEGEEEV